MKHSFVDAGACRCTMLINFSNNKKYGGTIRRPAPIMMQSYVLVVSASVSTASAVLPSRLRYLFENYAFDTDGEEQRLIKTLPEP